MKIAVIGAGIAGVTTAYQLAMDGHSVTVFEKSSAAAELASFAHPGVVSPEMLLPLSHPVWPQKSWLRNFWAASNVSVRAGVKSHELEWLVRWKGASGTPNFFSTFDSLFGLLNFSLACTQEVTAKEGIEYEHSEGQIALLNDAEFLALAGKLTYLKEKGGLYQELATEKVRVIEPALSDTAKFQRAIFFPRDIIGNCRQFALVLKSKAQALGVTFRFNADVALTQTPSSAGVTLNGGGQAELFEHIVLCTGALTGKLIAPLKMKLPLVAIAGQSLSLRIREPLNAPRSAVFDASSRTHIARIGNRVRISGGTKLGQMPVREDKALTNVLYKSLQHYFPGAAHLSEGVQTWSGTFNVTPDGLPVIGKTAVPHISLNVGHGPNGWAMAAGAAHLLSADIAGRQAALDTLPFSPLRFG